MKYYLLAMGFLFVVSPAQGEAPWRRHAIDHTSRGADGVRLADFNGDQLLDIATGWEEGGVVRIYSNPGPQKVRQPWPATTVGRVKSPEDAVFFDANRDGRPDVVSCCEGSTRSVFLHLAPTENSTDWKTIAVPACAGLQAWMFALPFEVDGKNPYLIVGSKGKGASVSRLVPSAKNEDFEGWKLQKMRDAGWIMSLQAHDMDHDGDRDLLFSDRLGSRRGVCWLENPGEKYRESDWQEHTLGLTDREVLFLCRGDANGDGRADIACAVKGPELALLIAPKKQGLPWKQETIPLSEHFGNGKGVALGDLSGNGKIDLVFTCESAEGKKSGAGYVALDFSSGSLKTTLHDIGGPKGVKFDRIELLDLDADGDLDLLTCEERDNLGVIWYENPRKENEFK